MPGAAKRNIDRIGRSIEFARPIAVYRAASALNAHSTDERVSLVERFFSGTASSYDTMVRWATLGFDGRWKKRMLTYVPVGDGPVLDLACGTGISTLSIARAFPGRLVVGIELRDEYLRLARAKSTREPGLNIQFALGRAEDFHSPLEFDCITSSYLAKYADLPRLVPRCRAMLRQGGVMMMHDFTLPPKPALLALWRLYFFVMRGTVARALPSWAQIYRGLPTLIERTRWVSELQVELERHRFTDVRVDPLTLYGSAIVTAVKA